MKKILLLGAMCAVLFACKKEDPIVVEDDTPSGPQLRIGLEFDASLPRLDNFGNDESVPAGNAAQSPQMNEVSLHYIEFAESANTWLGDGSIVYNGIETTAGGDAAVDFDQAAKGGNGSTILSMDLSTLPPGTYEWLRVSLTYQNYDIDYRLNYPPYIENGDFTGTLASFVGFNTYITSHTVKDSVVVVNDDKVQGYWAFETGLEVAGFEYGSVDEGEGAGVTVVNPLSATSPIPAGSCVVTGQLDEPLVITGDETEDIKVVLAFSINNSFEWIEVNADGKFEPGAGETVVDMGLRGLHPYVD